MPLTGYVTWLIKKEDPKSYDLKFIPGWTVLNPLTYLELGINEGNIFFPFVIRGVIDENVLLKTNTFLLSSTTQSFDDFIKIAMNNSFQQFVNNLRLLSRQAELSRSLVGGAGTLPDIDEIPSPAFPQTIPENSKWIMQNDIDTAVTWKQVEQSDTSTCNNALFIPHSILVDALQAFLERDDRRTILYAAMAVEILANTKLIDAGKKPNDKLKRGESYVAAYFDRLSSQLLGKSLKQDNQTLFDNISRLYNTRNDIVHEGTVSSEIGVLQITGEGARLALQYASEVFRWLDEPYDILPTHGGVVAQVAYGFNSILVDGPLPRFLPR